MRFGLTSHWTRCSGFSPGPEVRSHRSDYPSSAESIINTSGFRFWIGSARIVAAASGFGSVGGLSINAITIPRPSTTLPSGFPHFLNGVSHKDRSNLGPVWSSHSGAGVPTARCCEVSVVTLGDIVEGGLILVQCWIDIADRLAVRRIDSRDQTSPQRRHRASSADHRTAAVDPYVITSVLVGVARHIGDAPMC
jgi:hypothetical protein